MHFYLLHEKELYNIFQTTYVLLKHEIAELYNFS